MRFWGRSRSGSKTAGLLGWTWGALLILYRIVDWIVGKLGWLGVFTSPEDLQTAMERFPIWSRAAVATVGPYIYDGLLYLRSALAWATSYEALVTVLLVFVALNVVDVDELSRRLSALKFRVVRCGRNRLDK